MQQLSANTMHRFLLRAANSAGTVFAWILIFHALYYSGETAGGALICTAFAYILSQMVAFFLTPLTAMNLGNGTQRSILFATLALSVAYLWLAGSSIGVFGAGVSNLWVGIAGFVILTGVYRAFYWIPYKAANGTLPTPQTNYLFEIFLTLMPISASIVINGFVNGSWLLLVGCAALSFLAAAVLIGTRESYEPYVWTYGETMRNLFDPENRATLLSAALNGAQAAALLFLWPLALFLLFDWSYQMLGAIMSVTLLLTVLAKKAFPHTLRILGVEQSAAIRGTLAATSWVLRLAIFSPVSVVLADVVFHAGAPSRTVGIDQLSYEQAADAAHFVDHQSVLKELGYALGRSALAVVLIIFAFYGSPLAALALTLAVVAIASFASLARYAPGKLRSVI